MAGEKPTLTDEFRQKVVPLAILGGALVAGYELVKALFTQTLANSIFLGGMFYGAIAGGTIFLIDQIVKYASPKK